MPHQSTGFQAAKSLKVRSSPALCCHTFRSSPHDSAQHPHALSFAHLLSQPNPLHSRQAIGLLPLERVRMLQAVLVSRLQDRDAGSGTSEDLMKAVQLCDKYLTRANGTEAELEVLKSVVRQTLAKQVKRLTLHANLAHMLAWELHHGKSKLRDRVSGYTDRYCACRPRQSAGLHLSAPQKQLQLPSCRRSSNLNPLASRARLHHW